MPAAKSTAVSVHAPGAVPWAHCRFTKSQGTDVPNACSLPILIQLFCFCRLSFMLKSPRRVNELPGHVHPPKPGDLTGEVGLFEGDTLSKRVASILGPRRHGKSSRTLRLQPKPGRRQVFKAPQNSKQQVRKVERHRLEILKTETLEVTNQSYSLPITPI